MRALELEKQWDILCNLGRVEGELLLDAEALTHLDECLKEYPPSTDLKVQQARAKFYDLRTEIRARCEEQKCAYKEPVVSSGLEVAPAKPPEEVKPAPKAPETAPPTETPTKPVLSPEEHPPYIEKPSAKWPVVITTGALGVVGLGLGVGFHFLAEDKKNEALGLQRELIDDDIACSRGTSDVCAGYISAKSSFLDARMVETVGFVAGGTLATAAVVMAIVWPDRNGPKSASLQPIFAIDGHGSFWGVSGRF